MRTCFNAQVRSTARRLQIRGRRAAAPTVVSGQLKITSTVLRRSIEVIVAGNAERSGTVDECIDQQVPVRNIGHFQRSVAAVKRTGPALIALVANEVRQHIVVAPADIAESSPLVIVLTLPTDVDESVDGARSAQRLSPRPVNAASVHTRLGIGVEAPVVSAVPHRLAITNRQVNPD